MRTPTTTPAYEGLTKTLDIILHGKQWKDQRHILAGAVENLLKIRSNHFDHEMQRLREQQI